MKEEGSGQRQGLRTGRHFERFDNSLHDPFQPIGKLASPSVCDSCGVVFENGRWCWPEHAAPAGAAHTRCPACLRTEQDMPAGRLLIRAELSESQLEEIMMLMRNVEAREKREHPLQRIMGIEQQKGQIEVSTTDVHLATGLGHALRHAYGGKLEQQFAQGEHMVRVNWTRESSGAE